MVFRCVRILEGREISIPDSSIHIILFRLLKHQIIQNPAKMHERNGSCRYQSLCSDAPVALLSEQAFHRCNYVKCPIFCAPCLEHAPCLRCTPLHGPTVRSCGHLCCGQWLNTKRCFHVSNEKTGCLGYIGDYTAQFYGDYNKPL